MLEISKEKEPDFFDTWIKNKKEHSRRLRRYMLENEQGNVCCYCEKKVGEHQEESHIDHVRPRDKFPKLIDSYSNLVVSCQTKGRCGNAKGNKFSELFIVPTEEKPADYFTYSANGEIRAIASNPKAAKTIDTLNLNAPALVKARRTLFKQLSAMGSNFEAFADYFNEYPTFLDYYRQNHLLVE